MRRNRDKNIAEELPEEEMSEEYLTEAEQFIHREALNMKIPEKLEPENMQRVLEASSKKMKSRRRRHLMAAAAILIVIGGSLLSGKLPFLAQQINDGQSPLNTTGSAKLPGDILSYAGSYDAVEAGIREAQKRSMDNQHGTGLFNDIGALVDGAMDTNKFESEGSASSSGEAADYSTTNVQVEGVDEADIAKTDGKYIYRLQSDYNNGEAPQTLEIISADKGKLEKMGTFTFDTQNQVSEFYLYQNMAIAIAYGYVTTAGSETRDESKDILAEGVDATEDIPYTDCFTQILFINIEDRKNPVKIGELTQSGYYVQSRLTDGYLYLVTGEDAWAGGDNENDIWIPCVEHKRVSADHIFIPEGAQDTSFTTIASVDLKNTGQYADSRSILASSDNFYMSKENIYLYNTKYMSHKKEEKHYTNTTEITKFHYSEGNFSGKATGEIAGSIRDSFAINEYEGKLRIVTSVTHSKRTTVMDNIRNVLIGYQDNTEKTDNSVYVLDENLAVLGSITGIAKDERVYSARFQKDVGYFVTYKETDPLFSVDFSDPEHPVLIGELKLPGFSDYLHFYSDTLLLGIGESGNGNIKLSMFDISDPAKVKEIDKHILKDMEFSQALQDYRSVLIDPEKNIIGFSGEMWADTDYNTKEISHYDCFSWDKDKGFTRILKHIFNNSQNQEYSRYENSRGIYIGNTLYVIEYYSSHITAYNLKNGRKIGML